MARCVRNSIGRNRPWRPPLQKRGLVLERGSMLGIPAMRFTPGTRGTLGIRDTTMLQNLPGPKTHYRQLAAKD